MEPRIRPQKTSRLLMGLEQIMRPKTLQAIWWWWSKKYNRHFIWKPIWLCFWVYLETDRPTNQPTFPKEQSPGDGNNCSASQNIFRSIWNLKVHYHYYLPFRFKSWNGLVIHVQTMNRLYWDKFLLGKLIRKGDFGCRINIAQEESVTEWVQSTLSKEWAWAEHWSTIKMDGVLQLNVP